MPPHERSLPASYLHSVLRNGSMPFRYRSGVRLLLGMAANANAFGLAAASAPPMELRYAPAYSPASIEAPVEGPAEQWLEAHAVAREAGDAAEGPGQPQSRSLQRQESAAPEELTMGSSASPLQPEQQSSQPTRQRFFESAPSSNQETEAVPEALLPESPATRVVAQTTMTIPGLSSQHASSALHRATHHMGMSSHPLPSQATVQESTLASQAVVFPYAAAVPASLETFSGSAQAPPAALQQERTASSEEQRLAPHPSVELKPDLQREADLSRLGFNSIPDVAPSGVTAVQKDSGAPAIDHRLAAQPPTAPGTTHDRAVIIPGPRPDGSATMASARGGATGRSAFPPSDLPDGRLEHRASIFQAYPPQGDQPVAPTDLLGLQRHRAPSGEYVSGVLGAAPEMPVVPTTSPAMLHAAEQITRLQRTVATLTARVAAQQDVQAPPVPTPPVPVPRERPAALATTSHAFWERHYVSRLYRWSRR